eukprot:753491-Hanusia_phi.AAC.3
MPIIEGCMKTTSQQESERSELVEMRQHNLCNSFSVSGGGGDASRGDSEDDLRLLTSGNEVSEIRKVRKYHLYLRAR